VESNPIITVGTLKARVIASSFTAFVDLSCGTLRSFTRTLRDPRMARREKRIFSLSGPEA
jgi:hypothetical protein